MLFSNSYAGINTSLFYQINIPLVPFQFDGEQYETCIQLDFITLPAKSYNELENTSLTFPCNPEDGYIDGSVYIDGMHNPFDVTNIVFDTIEGYSISAELKATLQFEDGSIKPTDILIAAKLNFGNIELHCDKLKQLSNFEICENVGEMLDTSQFQFDPAKHIFHWKK